ncbi:hypothetical protein FIV42_08115 [Persicimonas caeni]|uniref:Uncharacterized protein n=1 Tax=Persicimonas caeni TaxID=2292766 RepID=A0A4Y6PSD5_PERCE|nr:hypothetical protein [Persicimonas caeni]QDG50695.1 hypothetical protein FIV42_08115 [Persicimonas caeni]QED31916.1 hypothetical protein FRD00_08110 [Persicimonas caeni]
MCLHKFVLAEKAIIITTLALLSVGFVSLTSSPSHACSPPQSGWSLTSEGAHVSQPIPTDGVVSARAYFWEVSATDNLPSFDVVDSGGNAVEGTVTALVLSPSQNDQPPGQSGEAILIWKPDAQLAPETSYTVTIQATHPYDEDLRTIDETATFETTSGPMPPLEPVSLSAGIKVTEVTGDVECCKVETSCDSCGICSSETCWPLSYDYLPTVSATVSLPDDQNGALVYYEVLANGERTRLEDSLRQGDVIDSTFEADADGPFCVEVVTIRLVDGTSASSGKECFERSDLPDFQRRSPSASRPAQCLEEADGGCSTSGTTARPFPWALLLVVVAGVRLARRQGIR